jgi:hypothetical protein
VALSQPFAERLFGALRRHCRDQLLGLATSDRSRKLADLADDDNEHRCHAGISGVPPADRDGTTTRRPRALRAFRWRSHCRGLFQTPVAA